MLYTLVEQNLKYLACTDLYPLHLIHLHIVTPYHAHILSGSNVKQSCLQNEPQLHELMDLVASRIQGKWRDVGIQLYLDEGELSSIAESEGQYPLRCFTSVFTTWKKKQTRDFSWETLLSALRTKAVGENRLADEVSSYLTSRES